MHARSAALKEASGHFLGRSGREGRVVKCERQRRRHKDGGGWGCAASVKTRLVASASRKSGRDDRDGQILYLNFPTTRDPVLSLAPKSG